MSDMLVPTDFSWRDVVILRSSQSVGNWPATSTPIHVAADRTHVTFEHTKAGQWPVVRYGNIDVEGVIWIVVKVGGQWYAATWDRLRPGQTIKAAPVDEYGRDQIRVAPLDASWPGPRDGEVVGYFVSTPARDQDPTTVNERSLIAWVRFNESGFALERREDEVPAPPPPGPPPPPPGDDVLTRVLEVVARLQDQQLAIAGRVTELLTLVQAQQAQLDALTRDQHGLTDELKRYIRDGVHADVLAVKARRTCRFL